MRNFNKGRAPEKQESAASAKGGDLYETYIRPAIPYGIRGVLWDQGENDTGLYSVSQDILMGALIRG